jgi:hypothetical protein
MRRTPPNWICSSGVAGVRASGAAPSRGGWTSRSFARSFKEAQATLPKGGEMGVLGMLSASGELGIVGVLRGGNSPAPTTGEAPSIGRAFSCPADVRLVADLASAATAASGHDAPPSRYVVGSIPRGQTFHVADSGAELSYLSLGETGVSSTGGARLAIPARDVAACQQIPAEPTVASGKQNPAGQIDKAGPVPSATPSPRGNATIAAPKVTGGPIANAARVVAGMRAGFRACYNRALANNANIGNGSVSLGVAVGPNGEVLSAEVSSPARIRLTNDVVDCIVRRVKSAHFAPPEKVPARVTFVIDLARDKASPPASPGASKP